MNYTMMHESMNIRSARDVYGEVYLFSDLQYLQLTYLIFYSAVPFLISCVLERILFMLNLPFK